MLKSTPKSWVGSRFRAQASTCPLPCRQRTRQRDWYLDHDAWGSSSELGCPYLDVRCEERGVHLLVFGHRLGRSHHMFTELAGTHEQSTFDAIGNATWNSRAGSEVFEPVLSLVVDKDDALIQRFEFDSPSELRDWLTDLLARSAAHTGNASDIALEARRALTLVTCAEARRGGAATDPYCVCHSIRNCERPPMQRTPGFSPGFALR